MTILHHFKREAVRRRFLLGGTGLCALLSVALFSLPSAAPCENEQQDLIKLFLFNDMLYGSDDFFGDNTELLLADGVRPSPREQAPTGARPSEENREPPVVVPPEPPVDPPPE